MKTAYMENRFFNIVDTAVEKAVRIYLYSKDGKAISRLEIDVLWPPDQTPVYTIRAGKLTRSFHYIIDQDALLDTIVYLLKEQEINLNLDYMYHHDTKKLAPVKA